MSLWSLLAHWLARSFSVPLFRSQGKEPDGDPCKLFGSFCLVVVVFTHVAEAFHLLPGMGWGLPNSAGRYLDLCSAIIGLILLPLGYALARPRNGRRQWKP